jgi:hypothetical protein
MHALDEAGQDLGVDVCRLGRELPGDPACDAAQAGQQHAGQPDHPLRVGLRPPHELGHRRVACGVGQRPAQQHHPQLAEGDRPAGKAVADGRPLQGERLPAGDEQGEGRLEGVEGGGVVVLFGRHAAPSVIGSRIAPGAANTS